MEEAVEELLVCALRGTEQGVDGGAALARLASARRGELSRLALYRWLRDCVSSRLARHSLGQRTAPARANVAERVAEVAASREFHALRDDVLHAVARAASLPSPARSPRAAAAVAAAGADAAGAGAGAVGSAGDGEGSDFVALSVASLEAFNDATPLCLTRIRRPLGATARERSQDRLSALQQLTRLLPGDVLSLPEWAEALAALTAALDDADDAVASAAAQTLVDLFAAAVPSSQTAEIAVALARHARLACERRGGDEAAAEREEEEAEEKGAKEREEEASLPRPRASEFVALAHILRALPRFLPSLPDELARDAAGEAARLLGLPRAHALLGAADPGCEWLRAMLVETPSRLLVLAFVLPYVWPLHAAANAQLPGAWGEAAASGERREEHGEEEEAGEEEKEKRRERAEAEEADAPRAIAPEPRIAQTLWAAAEAALRALQENSNAAAATAAAAATHALSALTALVASLPLSAPAAAEQRGRCATLCGQIARLAAQRDALSARVLEAVAARGLCELLGGHAQPGDAVMAEAAATLEAAAAAATAGHALGGSAFASLLDSLAECVAASPPTRRDAVAFRALGVACEALSAAPIASSAAATLATLCPRLVDVVAAGAARGAEGEAAAAAAAAARRALLRLSSEGEGEGEGEEEWRSCFCAPQPPQPSQQQQQQQPSPRREPIRPPSAVSASPFAATFTAFAPQQQQQQQRQQRQQQPAGSLAAATQLKWAARDALAMCIDSVSAARALVAAASPRALAQVVRHAWRLACDDGGVAHDARERGLRCVGALAVAAPAALGAWLRESQMLARVARSVLSAAGAGELELLLGALALGGDDGDNATAATQSVAAQLAALRLGVAALGLAGAAPDDEALAALLRVAVGEEKEAPTECEAVGLARVALLECALLGDARLGAAVATAARGLGAAARARLADAARAAAAAGADGAAVVAASVACALGLGLLHGESLRAVEAALSEAMGEEDEEAAEEEEAALHVPELAGDAVCASLARDWGDSPRDATAARRVFERALALAGGGHDEAAAMGVARFARAENGASEAETRRVCALLEWSAALDAAQLADVATRVEALLETRRPALAALSRQGPLPVAVAAALWLRTGCLGVLAPSQALHLALWRAKAGLDGVAAFCAALICAHEPALHAAAASGSLARAFAAVTPRSLARGRSAARRFAPWACARV